MVAAHSKVKNGLQISVRELIRLLVDVNVGESAAVALISPFCLLKAGLPVFNLCF